MSEEYEILKRSIDSLTIDICEMEKEIAFLKRTTIFLYEKCYVNKKEQKTQLEE